MRTILLGALVTLSFSGCWLMPYQENFSCNNDIYNGRCGMVRDNYNYETDTKSDFKYVFDDNKTVQKANEIMTTTNDCVYDGDLEKFADCNQKYEYILIRKQRGE
ncbi:MAG: hypothetical protein RBT59_05405 [Arcobacteraceae bacterium]|jgi:hypothetical protein|nr:hypothetical protein [Arcobacteraceae bacterium]